MVQYTRADEEAGLIWRRTWYVGVNLYGYNILLGLEIQTDVCLFCFYRRKPTNCTSESEAAEFTGKSVRQLGATLSTTGDYRSLFIGLWAFTLVQSLNVLLCEGSTPIFDGGWCNHPEQISVNGRRPVRLQQTCSSVLDRSSPGEDECNAGDAERKGNLTCASWNSTVMQTKHRDGGWQFDNSFPVFKVWLRSKYIQEYYNEMSHLCFRSLKKMSCWMKINL